MAGRYLAETRKSTLSNECTKAIAGPDYRKMDILKSNFWSVFDRKTCLTR